MNQTKKGSPPNIITKVRNFFFQLNLMTMSHHFFFLPGGYDYEFVDGPVDQFECPICLLCLRNPFQTSCGHRFCYTCILTWQSEGMTCPYDKCTIGEGDLFPDSEAAEAIGRLRVKCPFSKARDCPVILPIVQMLDHEAQCASEAYGSQLPTTSRNKHEQESLTCPSCGELLDSTAFSTISNKKHNLICPNAQVACPLAGAGCSDLVSRAELPNHIQNSAPRHIQLLWEWLLKLQQIQSSQVTTMRERTNSFAGSPPSDSSTSETRSISARDDVLRMSGSNIHSTQRHMKDLFHRVVSLEQKHRQIELLNQNLRGQIRELKLQKDPKEDEKWEMIGRNCHGKFVWKINPFSEFHERMRHNHSFVLYSRGFYTSPFGYKVSSYRKTARQFKKKKMTYQARLILPGI